MNTRYTQQGQAVIIAVVLFLAGSLVVVAGVSSPVLRDIRTVNDFVASRQSFALAEGSVEEVAYRLMNGLQTSETESLTEGSTTASTSVMTVSGGRVVLSDGDERSAIRKSRVRLNEGSGAAFNYGVQADAGGFEIRNSASITGNAYANGPVVGANNNIIRGDVISAGPDGLVEDVHATGTVWSNTIRDSEIDGDAYYQTIKNTTVGGTEFPESEDQATTSLPISDEEIESWKEEAAAGGTLTCSDGDEHEIEEDVTIGPGKFPCDVDVSGDPVVTLAGPVWIEGDLEVTNSATFRVDSSLSGKTVQVIADVPSDRFNRGLIELQNTTTYEGAGEDSYILFISMNNAEEQGEDDEAITVQNSAEGDLLVYAPHGRVELQNRVSLRSVAAYTIELKNNTEVIYDTGVANLLFDSGPGGGFTIESWGEVK